jgi:hypothetical protein
MPPAVSATLQPRRRTVLQTSPFRHRDAESLQPASSPWPPASWPPTGDQGPSTVQTSIMRQRQPVVPRAAGVLAEIVRQLDQILVRVASVGTDDLADSSGLLEDLRVTVPCSTLVVAGCPRYR